MFQGSTEADSPPLWADSSDVLWQSPSLVYFTLPTHQAIDFMLLVGDENGTGATAPHVYMFQCKARMSSVTPTTLQPIVDSLDAKLDELLSKPFESHVLRRAGITSKKQVTLCVAALKIGKFDAKKDIARPPAFNVVLVDAAAFRGLGGAAFSTTRFMRFIEGKLVQE
jgi:hypothetical protein